MLHKRPFEVREFLLLLFKGVIGVIEMLGIVLAHLSGIKRIFLSYFLHYLWSIVQGTFAYLRFAISI